LARFVNSKKILLSGAATWPGHAVIGPAPWQGAILASGDRYGLGLVAAGQLAAGQDQIQSATHAAT